MNYKALKNLLDNLYFRYKKKFSSSDPVWNLHKFNNPEDIEIIGLVTSCYAYGQVSLINNFIGTLLDRIGNKPYEFTINFRKRKDKKFLKDLGYRFHKDVDIINLFHSIHAVLKNYGSLYNLFKKSYSDLHENITTALSSFSSHLVNNIKLDPRIMDTGILGGKRTYFDYLLPNPENGSTCKRLMLFLRWMVRKDDIDTGIWENIPASKLIIPVDVHISRIAKKLKLVKRRSVDLKFAVELTEKLKQFDPQDPVKYDFSLCHFQMEGKEF